MRLPATFGEGHVARWGFYDNSNGLFWQYDTVNKLSANIRRQGVDTRVVQANFTTDVLDGTGPSEVVLDMSRGIIWRIMFTWYGYGTINFVINISNDEARQCIVPCHQICVPGSTSVASPHLPLRAELINVSGSAAQSMFIAGRQFSVVGSFRPSSRMTPLWSSGRPYTNVITPIYAFRRKATHIGTNINLKGYDTLISSTGYMLISAGAAVTGGTWTTPENLTASETALECNTTFTGASGGVVVYGALVKADTSVEIAQHISLSETLSLIHI